MNTKQFFSAFLAAVFAVICFPAEKVSAQGQDGNFSHTPIDMVVNAGTSEERWATSHFGIVGPIGLRPDEQIAITLIASNTNRGYLVGIAPLDGGALLGAEDLVVAEDGTINFTFQGGNTPGIYRVVVAIGAEQYQLRLYVARPEEIPAICP
ncbi:MAG TPA: hypothetical protein VNT79_09295 [Phycisphaerae bacterium]|nr:hypothetical protein [Phycisphaerae bacterium]